MKACSCLGFIAMGNRVPLRIKHFSVNNKIHRLCSS